MADLDKRFPRYSKFLSLYPDGYREEYGEQMLQTLADMLDDPDSSHTAVWAHAVLDLPLSIVKQQLLYSGDVMAHTTTPYIKRNALIGAGLLAPFFAFIIANGFMHNRLQNSWVWHSNALFVWLVLLPSLAVIFNLVALLRWIHAQRSAGKSSMWQLLTDVRHNWPVLGVALLGLAILALVFGHDSVHCVSGNPIRELHNPHQTWQCIQKG